MKHFLTIIFFYFFIASPISNYAQPGRDKLEALRMSYIGKRLQLSNSESEKFWPLYNEYNDKIKTIRKNLRQNYRKAKAGLSDTQAEELYQLEQQSRQAETDVHKQYSEKLKAILGAQRMVTLRIAEDDFKKEMITEIKERND